MSHSSKAEFAEALDLIAESTGHHPLCVHLVGKQLAKSLDDMGFDGDNTAFLMILTDALTEGGICAGDAIAEMFEPEPEPDVEHVVVLHFVATDDGVIHADNWADAVDLAMTHNATIIGLTVAGDLVRVGVQGEHGLTLLDTAEVIDWEALSAVVGQPGANDTIKSLILGH